MRRWLIRPRWRSCSRCFRPVRNVRKAVALWGTIGSTGHRRRHAARAGFWCSISAGVRCSYVNVPVAIVIVALASSYLPRDRSDDVKHRLDVLGAVLLTAALVTFVYTIESIPRAASRSWQTLAGLGITVAIFAAFVAVERTAPRADSPAAAVSVSGSAFRRAVVSAADVVRRRDGLRVGLRSARFGILAAGRRTGLPAVVADYFVRCRAADDADRAGRSAFERWASSPAS